MEAVTITLDGVEVSGYPGMTILDLAREAGVDIPTLCHDAHLNPFGACRLCLVEDEPSSNLLASCVTPIMAGMIINTRSPRVTERRRVILQLMLASHPDACLICDKGNRCQLRQLSAEMGIGLLEFQKIPQLSTIEEVNPFIERDLTKCVLCAKCVRACEELVVEGAIDYNNRGFITRPATLGDLPLEKSECTFCGTCIALCPTGALTEKGKTYHGTANVTIETVCPFCGCGCGICLEVKDNQLVRAKPGIKNQVNRGTLCPRGSYGYDFVHSPDRLTSPLVRINGEFQETSWELALDRIAAEFGRIREEYGADSLAVFGSAKGTNEENYLLQRLARSVLGTNNIDNGSRLYSAASRVGLGWSLGFPGTTSSLNNLEQSDVILVIGSNPSVSAPAVGYAIKRAVKHNNTRLLLIDPRPTRLNQFAGLWLRPKIGTDIALINGLSRVIVEERLYDEEFVTRRTDGFEELVNNLDPYTPEYVNGITGISVQDIQLAARLFAGAKRASIVYSNGITQQISGTEAVTAIANLALLTGNTGQHGGGIYALQRENNAQGACDMGSLPDFLPGYRSLDDAQSRKIFDERWGSLLPSHPGLTALEMMERADEGKLKGMLIVGENPVSSFPGTALTKQALSSLEFLVVSDLFMTETARSATVVLPVASFAEKDGTVTNFEGRIRRVRQAIQPVGESLPDWEIVLRIADRMGQPMPYTSRQQVTDEIEEMVLQYQRPVYTDIDTEETGITEADRDHPGARRLYQGPFPSGFGRFAAVKYSPPVSLSEDGGPFILISGSILHHFGSGTRSRRAARLDRFVPDARLEISPADARRLGFKDNDNVRVVSPAGEATASIKITDTMPKGMLFLPISFPENPANSLFSIDLDPRAKSPAMKACAVKLERISNDGENKEIDQS